MGVKSRQFAAGILPADDLVKASLDLKLKNKNRCSCSILSFALAFQLDAGTAHNVTLGTLRFLNDYGLDTLLNKPIPAQPIRSDGLTFPIRSGWPLAWTKTATIWTPWLRWVLVLSKSAPSPRCRSRATLSRACSAIRKPKPSLIAWALTTMAWTPWWTTSSAKVPGRARHQYRQERAHADGARGGRPPHLPEQGVSVRQLRHHQYLVAQHQNLRDLQSSTALSELLGRLKMRQLELAQQHGRYVPLVVKLAPDLEDEAIDDIAKVLLAGEIDGVIATNTTLSRDGVQHIPKPPRMAACPCAAEGR